MIVIADNLNTRNRAYMEALMRRDRDAVSGLARQLSGRADMINIQCSTDGAGDEETLPWALRAVQEGSADMAVSLDSRNVHALRKCIALLRKPPLINYLSMTEPADADALMGLAADSGASLVLRASRAAPPLSLDAKLQIAEELLERANAAGLSNDRLYADPSVVHIGKGVDQKHVLNSCEFIKAMKDMVEPPVNTVAWISNISSGMPRARRAALEAAFLSYLAGAGLDAAMVNVLEPEIVKTVFLIKSFRDETVFSAAAVAELA